MTDVWEIILRLGAATLIGAALGLNRELHDKPAGMRTHALVALGAATLIAVSVQVGSVGGAVDSAAVSRVIQGVITGIGFLGGGVILRDRENRNVYGLTTAASIWVVACLGVACGAGYWRTSLVALVIALIVLSAGEQAETWLRRVLNRDSKTDEYR